MCTPRFTHLQSALTDILQFQPHQKGVAEKALKQIQEQVLPGICILSLTCCSALLHRLADNHQRILWFGCPKALRS